MRLLLKASGQHWSQHVGVHFRRMPEEDGEVTGILEEMRRNSRLNGFVAAYRLAAAGSSFVEVARVLVGEYRKDGSPKPKNQLAAEGRRLCDRACREINKRLEGDPEGSGHPRVKLFKPRARRFDSSTMAIGKVARGMASRFRKMDREAYDILLDHLRQEGFIVIRVNPGI